MTEVREVVKDEASQVWLADLEKLIVRIEKAVERFTEAVERQSRGW